MAPVADSPKFSTLKKAPEDLEAQAVRNTMKAGQNEIEQEFGEMLDDHLADTLLPPLNLIVLVLHKMVPKILVSAKRALDSFFSKLPFSAILHLVLIDTLTIWIFYYSVRSVCTNVIVGASEHMHSDEVWPPLEQVDLCLAEHARRLLQMDGHLNPARCFEEETVQGPWPDDSQDAPPPFMAMINYGCLFFCMSLWFVVFGNFFWYTSCKFWVRYNSGKYIKCSFFTRRSVSYRVLCGFLAVAGILGIVAMGKLCADAKILEWYISSQMMNLLVVLLSARSFMAPTKPKFEYSELDQLNFRRPSFFQTNGGFAVALSDALIQSARGAQFRRPLVNLLAKGEDWQKALRICFIGKNSNSGNKALMKMWKASQDNLPKALNTLHDQAPVIMTAANV